MKLDFNREKLGRFCVEHGIARLELFGSALRDDFRSDSDVDLLATLRADAHPTLLDWLAVELMDKLFLIDAHAREEKMDHAERHLDQKSSRPDPLGARGFRRCISTDFLRDHSQWFIPGRLINIAGDELLARAWVSVSTFA